MEPKIKQDLLQHSKTKGLLSLYFSLTPEEKTILSDFGAHLTIDSSDENFSPKNLCQYLWVTAANIIPQGQYSLAKKILSKAITLADNDLDKAHIHANLAQVHADEKDFSQCTYHCNETISTGYFVPWAEKMKLEIQ